MKAKKTVMIIDDHPLFREGLKSIIKRNPTFEIVAEAGDAQQGLEFAKKANPDIIIVDISLPDGSGLNLTRDLVEMLPSTKVIIVTMHCKIDYITEAFQAGAFGYMVKDSASDRLLDALERVSNAEYFLDTSISSEVVKVLISAAPQKEKKIRDDAYGDLTPREQEITRLLAEGLSNKEIAEKLLISPKTVENHRANIINKLGLHSTVELIRYAARLGLIDVELWKS